MNAKRIRCLFCGGKHTESECISPTACEHRARMKLSLRVVELEAAMLEFVDEWWLTHEEELQQFGGDTALKFEQLLEAK